MNITERLLMGPGPSQTYPEVYQALSRPTVGHLDPEFLCLMDGVRDKLKKAFQTKNDLTLPVSATGSAGMECALVNVLEPGDRFVVGVNGVFGQRMAEIGRRLGTEVIAVESPFGTAIEPDAIKRAIDGKPTKLVAVVHAETSTGVWQPLEEISEICQESGSLFLIDCVTALGGIPVEVDRLNVDLAYSGTQKCLGCPPGLAPLTISEKAAKVIQSRKTPPVSWYLDLNLVMNYWGGERAYHHTAPINMIYGLDAALDKLLDEGLEASWKRHELHHRALMAGAEAMGLKSPIDPKLRLPQLNVIEVPNGVEDAVVRKRLLNEYDIEIGAGLGIFKGKVWRVGLMGHTARQKNVMRFLSSLEVILSDLNAPIEKGVALSEASKVYSSH